VGPPFAGQEFRQRPHTLAGSLKSVEPVTTPRIVPNIRSSVRLRKIVK